MSATPNKLHQFSNYNFTIVLSAYKNIDKLDINDDFATSISSIVEDDRFLVIAATGGTYNFPNSALTNISIAERLPSARNDYFIDLLDLDLLVNIREKSESIIPTNIGLDAELEIRETYGFSFLNVAKSAYMVQNSFNENETDSSNPSIFGGSRGIFNRYLLSIFFNKNISDDISSNSMEIKPLHAKISFVGGNMKINETGTTYRLKIQFFSGSALLKNEPAAKQENLELKGKTVQDFIDGFKKARTSLNDNKIEYKIIPVDEELTKKFFESDIVDLGNDQNLTYKPTRSLYDIALGFSSGSKSAIKTELLPDAEETKELAKLLFKDNANIARISSALGPRTIDGITAEHNGLDYAVKVDTPVYSIFDGTIIGFEDSNFNPKDKTGSGYFVKIRSIDKKYTASYAHFSKSSKEFLKIGDQVKAGDKIGLSGNTGRSTGPHLHLTFTISDTITDARKFINPNFEVPTVTNETLFADEKRQIKQEYEKLKNSTPNGVQLTMKNDINSVLYDLLLNSEFFLDKFTADTDVDVLGVPKQIYFLNSYVEAVNNNDKSIITYYVQVKEIFTPIYQTNDNAKTRKSLLDSRTIKEYNYLYTGQNIDILNFDLTFNNIAGYFFPRSYKSPVESSSTATTNEDVSNATEAIANELQPGDPDRETLFENINIVQRKFDPNNLQGSAASFYRNIIFPFTAYDQSLTVAEIDIVGDPDLLPKLNSKQFAELTGTLIKLNIGGSEGETRTFAPTENWDGRMFSAYYQLTKIKAMFSNNGQFKMTLKANILVDHLLEPKN